MNNLNYASYWEKWQQGNYGDVLPNSDAEPEDETEDLFTVKTTYSNYNTES